MRLCHKTKVSYDALFSGQARADLMVCIYLRKDGYLCGTLYVSHCAREDNASLCSLLFSAPRTTISVNRSPMFNAADRRAHPTVSDGNRVKCCPFYRVVCAAD